LGWIAGLVGLISGVKLRVVKATVMVRTRVRVMVRFTEFTEGHQCFTDGINGHRQWHIQPTLQTDS